MKQIMMRKVVLFTLFLQGFCPFAAALDSESWLADLDEFVARIHDVHIAPFHTVSEAEFDAAVESLREQIPSLNDHEIALEMTRIAAMIKDGHTWLAYRGLDGASRLPLSLYPFADGVFVVYAMPPYEHLVGKRITRIGNGSVDEVIEAVSPYVARDNEWSVLERIPVRLVWPHLLRVLGFVDGVDTVTLGVEDEDGSTTEEVVEVIEIAEYRSWFAMRERPDDLPLYRARAEETFWMTYLEKEKALYTQFNEVQNMDGGLRLGQFAKEIEEAFEENGARKLIIDLRHNGGGNGSLLDTLINRIARNEKINRRGHLFVLTGRRTFSAALMFTARMELRTEALFAGEPGGGKPNSYSEYNGYALTNSKLFGSISSIFHAEGLPGDAREYIPVDIPVALTSGDYFEGRDPVLEAVLEYRE